jgi:hypothetical protein
MQAGVRMHDTLHGISNMQTCHGNGRWMRAMDSNQVLVLTVTSVVGIVVDLWL